MAKPLCVYPHEENPNYVKSQKVYFMVSYSLI